MLTSVGLDHTEWLGKTELEIAAEKLAVLRDASTLVLGRVSGDVRALAERVAAERAATLVIAPEDPGPGVEVAATGPFQRRNFALATAAVEAFLGAVDPEKVAAVAAEDLVADPSPRDPADDRAELCDRKDDRSRCDARTAELDGGQCEESVGDELHDRQRGARKRVEDDAPIARDLLHRRPR